MWLYNELVIPQGAPSADVTVPMLQKVDRTVELIGPTGVHDPASRIVDNHQRSRRDDGEHRPVFGTDKAVTLALQVQIIQQHQWQRAPFLDQSAEEHGAVQVETRVKRERGLNFPLLGLETDHMG